MKYKKRINAKINKKNTIKRFSRIRYRNLIALILSHMETVLMKIIIQIIFLH